MAIGGIGCIRAIAPIALLGLVLAGCASSPPTGSHYERLCRPWSRDISGQRSPIRSRGSGTALRVRLRFRQDRDRILVWRPVRRTVDRERRNFRPEPADRSSHHLADAEHHAESPMLGERPLASAAGQRPGTLCRRPPDRRVAPGGTASRLREERHDPRGGEGSQRTRASPAADEAMHGGGQVLVAAAPSTATAIRVASAAASGRSGSPVYSPTVVAPPAAMAPTEPPPLPSPQIAMAPSEAPPPPQTEPAPPSEPLPPPPAPQIAMAPSEAPSPPQASPAPPPRPARPPLSRFALIAPAEAAELPPPRASARRSEIAAAPNPTPQMPPSSPRVAATGAGSGRIFVQAGAFSMRDNAQKVQSRIARLGSVQVSANVRPTGSRCIVCGSARSAAKNKPAACSRVSSTAAVPARASSATKRVSCNGGERERP